MQSPPSANHCSPSPIDAAAARVSSLMLRCPHPAAARVGVSTAVTPRLVGSMVDWWQQLQKRHWRLQSPQLASTSVATAVVTAAATVVATMVSRHRRWQVISFSAVMATVVINDWM
jgi:hypothetical protein